MAIQVSGTTVVGNSRSLENIASTDATTTNTIKNAIGLTFTPVQQGGGAGQLSSNKVYIGWTGTELKAQVDTYDQGAIAFKSDIPNVLNASGTAPIYACRAWVNFNGIGTVAIRASGNVSSITDNGGGDYTVNFATAMPDANYATVVAVGGTSGIVSGGTDNIIAAVGSVDIFTFIAGSSPTDCSRISVAIFR